MTQEAILLVQRIRTALWQSIKLDTSPEAAEVMRAEIENSLGRLYLFGSHFPVQDDGETARRMVEDRARAEERANPCQCDNDLRAQMDSEGKRGLWSWHNARCTVHQLGYERSKLTRAIERQRERCENLHYEMEITGERADVYEEAERALVTLEGFAK